MGVEITRVTQLSKEVYKSNFRQYGQMEKQRWEESEKRRVRRERVSRKKIQVREKVEKSRNTVSFQSFVAREGRKVSSCGGAIWANVRWKIERRWGTKQIWKSKCSKHLILRTLLEVERSKKCTRLWREAHFQASQTVKSTSGSEHFWKLKCSKKCMLLWREAHFGIKMIQKHLSVGALLAVKPSKQCTPLWREAHFDVRMVNAHHIRTTLGRSMSFFVAGYTTTTTSTTTTPTTTTTPHNYTTQLQLQRQLQLQLHTTTTPHNYNY